MRVNLKHQAYQIDWEHARFDPRPLTLPSGKAKLVHGSTVCVVAPVDVGGAVTGTAWCSVEDVFKKERGRKESLTVALRRMGISREERAHVWSAYHGRG